MDSVRLRRLRAGLRATGFNAAAAASAFGHELGAASHAAERPLQQRRLDGLESPLATALGFFVLELPAGADELDRALGPATADDLVELGLAEEHDGALRATVRILPHDPLLIAADVTRHLDRPDLVTGVTRPTTLLGQLTVRRPVRRALDLGTGNGVLALLCSAHAGQVVATDINEHALELGELNAALNGIENVEFRLGSFLEPVEGETFDLIVSNPPYVISPETEFLYRDAGLPGDGLSEQVTRMLPGALADGGFASFTLSWIANDGEIDERPRAWLEGSGCDAWLFHTASDDPLTTAAMWNKSITDPAEYGAVMDRWVEWYGAHGITRLAYGVCVIRRREGDNWFRASKLPAGSVRESSAHLLRLFEAQDFLAATPDLAGASLAPADDLVVEHSLRRADGAWTATGTQLRLDGGLGFTAALDGASSAVVSALDGRPLRGMIDEEREAAALELVRRLVELGFVVPG
jgi:SAM-dependent methyltransferase